MQHIVKTSKSMHFIHSISFHCFFRRAFLLPHKQWNKMEWRIALIWLRSARVVFPIYCPCQTKCIVRPSYNLVETMHSCCHKISFLKSFIGPKDDASFLFKRNGPSFLSDIRSELEDNSLQFLAGFRFHIPQISYQREHALHSSQNVRISSRSFLYSTAIMVQSHWPK